MKKMSIAVGTICALFILGACTANNNGETKGSTETSMMSKKEESTEQTSNSSDKVQKQSVFTAILVEDGKKNETVDQSIRLVLNEVEAVIDPEEILNMMKNDGVILNVSTEQLAAGLTEADLRAGDKIQFTLVGLPAMTMSIPPQVAGNSVIKVEKI
ncbi:hypothetical protein A5819_002617 [Enterococcus sp. 7E2_DIV0204]|uniref:Lipoprotein n=1 Tax=Candidatus Enterococcus lemimoniae TaxID=1834167 RepID=A0ABZ2T319_9ENTE|nr:MULTISPECIES: hypothetical protein [unclassified Enterococcus]OTN90118.1 hypothetical protein A5819_002617 [Enterococcus sp. 7E2_DIV0204]OTO68972.1 hypothetical protein A5866_001171 [Enterococcus sp. 12C11_DIV0727]OTP52573.1 hypothetical protein A5884_001775 [Enterococcus sp. 7D2_DIV0200]